jgi:uridine kinase
VSITEYNFDHPNALDFDLAYKTLINLRDSSEKVAIPQYSFIEHARMKDPAFVGPANIIFFEGLMAFHDKRIRDLLTYKIFINCDGKAEVILDDIRLCRRLRRDTTERGRSVISVLEQYNKFVKKAFRDFILPTAVYADIIIPGFRNNRVSVDFIVQNIKNMAKRITFKERAIKTKIFIFG